MFHTTHLNPYFLFPRKKQVSGDRCGFRWFICSFLIYWNWCDLLYPLFWVNHMSKVGFLDKCFSFVMVFRNWALSLHAFHLEQIWLRGWVPPEKVRSHLYREERLFSSSISHSAVSRESLYLRNKYFILNNDLYLKESMLLLHDFEKKYQVFLLRYFIFHWKVHWEGYQRPKAFVFLPHKY